MVTITHFPIVTLVDEDVAITVHGLTQDEEYTLRSQTIDDRDNMFECYAFYKSDKNGDINLSKDISLGGLYKGVESMGLFWALTASTQNTVVNIRLVKQIMETPLVVTIGVFKGWSGFDELRKMKPLQSVPINRWYKRPGVKRVPIAIGLVRGTLFIPEGIGPFKGVIDMFGGAGGLFEFRASMLATRGFITLALQVIDIPGQDTPMNTAINLRYFEDAVELLRTHPQCIRSGVGVVGVSLGSAIAFAMAAYVPGVRCCVCINSLFYMEGFGITYKGFRKPGIEYDGTKLVFDEKNGFDTFNCRKIPKDFKKLHPALLDIHKSNTKILFIAGKADRHFPMEEIVKSFKKLQKTFSIDDDQWMTKLYPGAGHLLELPNTPLAKSVYVNTINSYFFYGGETVGHAKAQKDSWNMILNFLNKNVSLNSNL